MSRPLLLDLFCGAGGAAMGYHRAGFDVIGVDVAPQPHYPFTFIQADALDVLENGEASAPYREGRQMCEVVAVHASPPCQQFTAYRRKGHGVGDGYANLIPAIRKLLLAAGLPYVIENVEQARSELRDPVKLCGSMFGLDVQRHRLFESNVRIDQPRCDHSVWAPRFPPATNRANQRKTVEVGVWRIPLHIQSAAMGIDWMTREELSQAIPPAYTGHVGRQLLKELL
ncbi:MAG TPA: DNA cytosine methyltransferase [Mycobacterium sp.]|nr:DNA cytosine methyltransferase [Mycobacterium sp.]